MKLFKITLVCAALALTACGKSKKSDDKKPGGDNPNANTKTIEATVPGHFTIQFAANNTLVVLEPTTEDGTYQSQAKAGEVPVCNFKVPTSTKGKVTVNIKGDDKKTLEIRQGDVGVVFDAEEEIKIDGNVDNTKLYKAIKDAKFPAKAVGTGNKKLKSSLSLSVKAKEGTTDTLEFHLSMVCKEEVEKKEDDK